jgi:surfeit locus 1 family protein
MTSTERYLIDVQLGRVRFRAGLVPTLATILLLPALIGLGLWQLDRADQKRQLQAEYDRRQAETPKRLRSVLEEAAALRYRPVRVRGRYEPDYQFLLDNRVHQGRAGYHVLTPLRIEDGDVRVLVNRGWVALGADRARLPRIDTPAGEVEIIGVATVPLGKGFRLGGVKPAGPGWQPLWRYLDLEEYARSVPFPTQPAVILLDPASPAGGFVRQWGRLDAGIQTHLGYALTWFSLAVALVAIYILVNVRRSDDAGSAPD